MFCEICTCMHLCAYVCTVHNYFAHAEFIFVRICMPARTKCPYVSCVGMCLNCIS